MSGFSSNIPSVNAYSSISNPTIRQTVLSGDTDASGYANFLAAGSGLAVNITTTYNPLVMAFASGFTSSGAIDYFSQVTSPITSAWILPANSTSYLYAERNPLTGIVTYGYSSLVPVYQTTQPVGSTSLVPVMTAATTNGVTITTSSDLSATYPGWKAFDGSTSTQWATPTTGYPHYITVDFGSSGYVVAQYSIQGNMSNGSFSPKSWVLSGSNDGTNWTALDTQTNVSTWAAGEIKTFAIVSPSLFTKYRFTINSNVGGTGDTDITEIKLYGNQQDQHWFDLSNFTMKVWNNAWVTKQRVFLGEAVTGASAVSSAITYALRGLYDSGRFSIAANTIYNKNHNIGCAPRFVSLLAASVVGGDLTPGAQYWNPSAATFYGVYYTALNKNTVSAVTGKNGAYLWTVPDNSTLMVEAKIIAERGW